MPALARCGSMIGLVCSTDRTVQHKRGSMATKKRRLITPEKGRQEATREVLKAINSMPVGDAIQVLLAAAAQEFAGSRNDDPELIDRQTKILTDLLTETIYKENRTDLPIAVFDKEE